MTSPKIALLLTGNELMTGDIVDSNSAMIATRFLDWGYQVSYKATVADDLPLLVSELDRLSTLFDVLLVNGGLGPTTDDLTAEALADALNESLVEHQDALEHLEKWCENRNYALTQQNRKQACLPESSTIIPNAIGSAVGFSAQLNDCLVMCTPGVPRELDRMLEEDIYTVLSARYPLSSLPKRHRLRVFGMGEASLQKLISEALPDWPSCIEIGYRASMPLLELKLKADQAQDYDALAQCYTSMHRLLGDHIVTEDSRTIAHVVLDLLANQNKTITFVESCTGGLIASLLTAISGSSAVFGAGYVTYSNQAKQDMVGVRASTLATDGAVSEAVVREMLAGALAKSNADIGIAISGIAGPTGGTADKPVGTVWIAWGAHDDINAKEFYVSANRNYFQQLVAAMALDLVRRHLIGSKEEPKYFRERTRK